MKSLKLTTLFLASFTLTSCSQEPTKGKSATLHTDTLDIAYTYWQPSGGPFIGMCGHVYSLVFTGTVTKISKPSKPVTSSSDTTTVLYTPQEGVIEINDIKLKHAPEAGFEKYPVDGGGRKKYFKSDCFYDLELKEGDKVLVFVYDYEEAYSISGNSILKIENFDDPVVLSTEKYIKYRQDPLFIQTDINIWGKYGLDKALKQMIDCRLSIKDEK